MNQFHVFDPIIVDKLLNDKQRINILKSFSKHGHNAYFKSNDDYIDQSYIIFSEIDNFSWEIQSDAPSLIISKIVNETELINLNLSIGNEVYFLDSSSWKIFETYSINKIQVSRCLGQFRMQQNKNYIDFINSKTYSQSMEERRGNFHGILLKGITDAEEPNINFPLDDLDSITKYFPNNDTYEMSYDIISGSYIDILHSIEKNLNFSTKLYKRKDGGWGTPKKLPNGTVAFKAGVP